MDDGGRATSRASIPQMSGVAAVRKRVPTTCTLPAKQKASKLPQPSKKVPNKKQPAAPVAGSSCGASKTLGNGPSRKANMQQPKQPESKPTKVDNLSARVTMKKETGQASIAPSTKPSRAEQTETTRMDTASRNSALTPIESVARTSIQLVLQKEKLPPERIVKRVKLTAPGGIPASHGGPPFSCARPSEAESKLKDLEETLELERKRAQNLTAHKEEILKRYVGDYVKSLKKEEQRYQALKARAEEKLDLLNEEIAQVRSKATLEMAARYVNLRKEQLRV
ncbi:uncharacterized protein [Erythrolamprus reginae]|uniref:uncharacterized protein n=1 Tax=Erythrolamprus reginae TaxID=121349 RepID=UPI00396CA79D